MGTFVKIFSTLSPLEIDQLLHKQKCLDLSQSNQRPTMNKFIVFAVVAIVAQFAENNVSAASESKLEWCCKVVKVHKNTPHRSWGTLTNKGIQQEWEKRAAMHWLLKEEMEIKIRITATDCSILTKTGVVVLKTFTRAKRRVDLIGVLL